MGRWRAKRHGRIRARGTAGLVAGAARDNVGLATHRTDGLPCLLLPGKPLGPGRRLYVGSAPRGSPGGVSCRDNAWAYIHNRSLAALLGAQGIRHLRTKPYRPRTNGKVERFHQTMAREWAYGLTYRTDRERARALPYWLTYYNERRPHSALAGQAPISRVRNLRGSSS